MRGATLVGARYEPLYPNVEGAHRVVAADFVSLDLEAAPYLSADQVLDQWIFADTIKVDCVWAAGKKLVTGGRHVSRETILPRFQAVMAALLDAG